MARRVKSVRTHIDTSADTGMLHAAQRRTQPQQSWCQQGYSMLHGDRTQPPRAHIPPSFLCFTGPNWRERRGPGNWDQRSRRKTETRIRAEAGKRCMQGRRAGQQRVEERVTSGETTRETGGSQQPSKGREQGRGHCKHTASTTPQQSTGGGGHQRDRRRATPRTTARTAQTPHTPHTPTPAPTARGQRAPPARSEGGQPGRGGA